MLPFMPEQFFSYDPINVVMAAVGFVAFLTIIVLISKPERDIGKVFFFVLFTLSIVGASAYMTGDTLYKVAISPTNGPVHWHADFRIFKCGVEVDLLDPSGLSNRIGTPVLHEHGDKRIHVEGTVAALEDISLGSFFDVIGGELTREKLIVPTNGGLFSMENGELCFGEEQTNGGEELQVFLWETVDGVAMQRKLDNFSTYIMAHEELIPPGDCVIFEFGARREKTDYLCEQYEVAEARGDLVIER